MRRGIIAITMCALAALACNLAGSPQVGSTPQGGGQPAPPDDGSRPTVTIEAPTNGSQAILRQQFTVRIRARDSSGVTRVVMREAERVVAVQPSPDPVRDFEALLPYLPTNTGRVTLEVVAYRNAVASDPASLTVEIVGSASELRNPGSLDPTAGVASGSAICTATVTVNNLNLRAGPGTSYRVITKLSIGENLDVIGRNNTVTWLQVRRGPQSQEGWVSAGYIQQNGDCAHAPVVNAP